VVVVGSSFVSLGQKKAALVRAGSERHFPFLEELAGVGDCVSLEMLFEFGEPDFHAVVPGVSVRRDVLGEGAGQGSGFADARPHYVMLVGEARTASAG
jgi:hypothetical protein